MEAASLPVELHQQKTQMLVLQHVHIPVLWLSKVGAMLAKLYRYNIMLRHIMLRHCDVNNCGFLHVWFQAAANTLLTVHDSVQDRQPAIMA